MTHVIQPLQLLVIALAGWLNRRQQAGSSTIVNTSEFLYT